MKEIFSEEGEVRVARPTKKAEIRISGLDESMKPEEIIDTVAAVGGCESKSIKIGEIKKTFPQRYGGSLAAMSSHNCKNNSR